jgi:uncharacterized membrane protein YhhN
MAYGFLGLVLLVDWVVVEKGWNRLEYVTKPVTILLLIYWLYFIDGVNGAMLWFLIGLLFSLAGDIFLMLPGGYFYRD